MSSPTRSSSRPSHARPASPSPAAHPRDASPVLGLGDDGPVSRKRRSDHASSSALSKRRRPNDTPAAANPAAGPLSDPGTAGATEELLKPSIVVRAHPLTPLSKPYMLLPLMLLPREHLPLASLDLAAPTGDLPLARHFQAHIRILELEGRLGSNILLARAPSAAATTTTTTTTTTPGFSSASSIFAIERDASNAYVLCKLGSWVDVRQLARLATAVCRQRMPAATPTAGGGAAGSMEPALLTPQAYKERGRRRLAIAELQSAVRRRPASQLAATATVAAPGDEPAGALLPDPPAVRLPSPPSSDAHKASPAPTAQTELPPLPPPPPPPPPPVEPAEPPTADGIFQNIRNQYAEALYHSMGSLAYFAKGPLSRARAAFHLDCDANLDMDDLVHFLKSLVLTTTMIDKKYRETVPEIVACLRTLGGYASDAAAAAAAAPLPAARKAKKPRKVKLGSSGLYPDEDAHVRRWWEASKPAPADDDEVFPRPAAVKYTVARLRTRETQLQMILILEILALEASGRVAAAESQLPGEGADAAPPSRKRSKQNLPLLLDVHADRLCIWQSTMADDVQALAESQQPRPAAGEPGGAGAPGDALKDFCVDILVPFFSPRLPLVCDALHRKLGGPVAGPPAPASRRSTKTGHARARSPSDKTARDKAAASSSSSSSRPHSSKPGAATVRRPAGRSASTGTSSAGAGGASSTRNLARVLSSERLRRSVSRGPNDAIAQMRSATAAPIPGLKREASEPATGLAQHSGLPPLLRRGASSSSSSAASAAASLTKLHRDRSLARSASDGLARTGGRAGPADNADGADDGADARARRKAQVEAELQEAISALKKPNRELAGKAVVEAAEKRLFAVRKPKKPTRPAAAADTRVQVKATPVNNRFHDVFVSTTTTLSMAATAASMPSGMGVLSHTGAGTSSSAATFSASASSVTATTRGGLSFGGQTASPRVAATPLAAGRQRHMVETTPVRGGHSGAPAAGVLAAALVPDSAVKASGAPSAVGRFALARARQAARPPAAAALADTVLASSPLQARVPRGGGAASAEAPASALFLLETPTKAKPIRTVPASPWAAMAAAKPAPRGGGTGNEENGAERDGVAASPAGARPTAAASSVQSLYEQMGWDDVDDLA